MFSDSDVRAPSTAASVSAVRLASALTSVAFSVRSRSVACCVAASRLFCNSPPLSVKRSTSGRAVSSRILVISAERAASMALSSRVLTPIVLAASLVLLPICSPTAAKVSAITLARETSWASACETCSLIFCAIASAL